jgi:hypothetical protein
LECPILSWNVQRASLSCKGVAQLATQSEDTLALFAQRAVSEEMDQWGTPHRKMAEGRARCADGYAVGNPCRRKLVWPEMFDMKQIVTSFTCAVFRASGHSTRWHIKQNSFLCALSAAWERVDNAIYSVVDEADEQKKDLALNRQRTRCPPGQTLSPTLRSQKNLWGFGPYPTSGILNNKKTHEDGNICIIRIVAFCSYLEFPYIGQSPQIQWFLSVMHHLKEERIYNRYKLTHFAHSPSLSEPEYAAVGGPYCGDSRHYSNDWEHWVCSILSAVSQFNYPHRYSDAIVCFVWQWVLCYTTLLLFQMLVMRLPVLQKPGSLRCAFLHESLLLSDGTVSFNVYEARLNQRLTSQWSFIPVNTARSIMQNSVFEFMWVWWKQFHFVRQ